MKLTCVKCGTLWAVSDKHSKIGPYVCPRCAKRGERNGAQAEDNTDFKGGGVDVADVER